MKTFRQLFYWCIGFGSVKMVRGLSRHSRTQFYNIGLVVIYGFIAITIISYFGIYRALNNQLLAALGSGFIGILTILVNRSLVMSVYRSKSKRSIYKWVPLLLLLLLPPFIISNVLKVVIFQSEIEQHSKEYFNNKILNYHENQITHSNKYSELSISEERLIDEKIKLQLEIRNEIMGKDSSGTPGIGPNFQYLTIELQKTEEEIQIVRISKDSLSKAFMHDAEQMYLDKQVTFVDRYEIFNTLSTEYPSIKLLSRLLDLILISINLLPFIFSFVVFRRFAFSSIREFIEIDQNLAKPLPAENLIENKDAVPNSNYESKNFNNPPEYKEKHNYKELTEKQNFSLYFEKIIAGFEREIERSNQKASLLLSRGIWTSLLGIIFYIVMGLIFQFILFKNEMKLYHYVGLASCTLLFIFIQFIASWFLKQYKYFVDTSTFYVKLKTNIDRYFLSYLAINEFDDIPVERKHEIYVKMIDFFSSEIKYPETYLIKRPDVNLAKEAFESATKMLNETLKSVKGGS